MAAIRVRQESRKQGWSKAPTLAAGIVKQLQRYDFPNNLRELEQIIYQRCSKHAGWLKGLCPQSCRRCLLDRFACKTKTLRALALAPELHLQMRSPWL